MENVGTREVEVSILCNAYNHEKYIAQTLDSFIMQKTTFAFEVLVHDDASTDNTASIIREYEEKYPDIIKPIYQTENQYSKNIGIGITFQIPRVKGKYTAICEGDDYWTDENKLQKQYDAMEAHPEIDICTHAVVRVDAETGKTIGKMAPSARDTVFTVEEVILGDGGFVGTNSIFCRSEMNLNIPAFRREFMYDYSWQIHGTLRGGMLYLSEPMSAYRVMVPGSWTVTVGHQRDRRHAFYLKMQNMLDCLNVYTGGKYVECIEKRKLMNEYYDLYAMDHCKELLSSKFISIYRSSPFKERMKVRAKIIMPKWFINIIRKAYSK